MLKNGNGLNKIIELGNGGGGAIIHGGKISHAKNVMNYGINMKMMFKYLNPKEFVS